MSSPSKTISPQLSARYKTLGRDGPGNLSLNRTKSSMASFCCQTGLHDRQRIEFMGTAVVYDIGGNA